MKEIVIRKRVAVCLAVVFGVATTAAHAQLRVLVTNDDGVEAEGISILIEELLKNPSLDITVIAPAINQSGSGDDLSSTPAAFPATTLAGFPATAVTGEPGDTVVLAVLELLTEPPDLVISGINEGQNITRDFAPFSGTVGAARWAARLGIPAIAASQSSFGEKDYQTTAEFVAEIADIVRADEELGNTTLSFDAGNGLGGKVLLSLNFPNCLGTLRGVRVVPLGELSTVTGYSLTSDDGMTQTYRLELSGNLRGPSDCESTLMDPRTDIEAFNNGFGAITPLNPDLSVSNAVLQDFMMLQALGTAGTAASGGGGGSSLAWLELWCLTIIILRGARRRCFCPRMNS
jgi:5'-nucleotidase